MESIIISTWEKRKTIGAVKNAIIGYVSNFPFVCIIGGGEIFEEKLAPNVQLGKIIMLDVLNCCYDMHTCKTDSIKQFIPLLEAAKSIYDITFEINIKELAKSATETMSKCCRIIDPPESWVALCTKASYDPKTASEMNHLIEPFKNIVLEIFDHPAGEIYLRGRGRKITIQPRKSPKTIIVIAVSETLKIDPRTQDKIYQVLLTMLSIVLALNVPSSKTDGRINHITLES